MSRWISGRLGRPIASIISVLMLVSILMPLAPPPVQAQTGSTQTEANSTNYWEQLSKGMVSKGQPVPLIVLDFTNHSAFHKGMLDRKMGAALSLALQATGKFSVYPRQDVDAKMEELGFTVPMDYSAQAMLADQLKSPYTVSGDLERVDVRTTRDGTFAEVQVSACVVSCITRRPINGARIVAHSSPKLAFDGNAGALIDEALSTAGYQITQRLLDNRMPLATVLIAPPDGQFRLRGGTIVGIKSGMRMITVRQESVTGVLRVVAVTPTECTCDCEDNTKGIAPGDRAVVDFTFEAPHNTPEAKYRLEKALGMVIGTALLVALIGHANTENDSPRGVTAAPLADAAALGYASGGNYVRWSNMGSHVMEYIIYRNNIPIAVVPASQSSYVDLGAVPTAVPTTTSGVTTIAQNITASTTVYKFAISANNPVPMLTTNTATPSKPETVDTTLPMPTDLQIWTVAPKADGSEIDVTTLNYPVLPMQVATYQVQSIYWGYVPTVMNKPAEPVPSTTGLFLGDMSAASANVMLLVPPVLSWPQAGADMDGTFQCAKVPGATSYTLQVSSSPTFASENTETIPAAPSVANPNLIEADYPLASMVASAKIGNASTVYVRMGACSVETATPVAKINANAKGYVFSATSQFPLGRALLLNKAMRPGFRLPVGVKSPAGRSGVTHRDHIAGRVSPTDLF